jgi:HSP20 family protein
MTLIKYNPLNNFIPTTFGDLVENMLNEGTTRDRGYLPAVDILRNEKDITLHVVAPGLTKEDFSLDIKEDRLVISGERKVNEDIKDTYQIVESRFGKFQRSFKLSKEVNADKISAKYENGILLITLPLVEKAELKKTIKIN